MRFRAAISRKRLRFQICLPGRSGSNRPAAKFCGSQISPSWLYRNTRWGASYLVEDFYKRFIKRNADPRHYVLVARIVTALLMVIAIWFSFQLETALQGFTILLQIGAGTGSIYLLRWFWWRVNAWSEITGMAVSFGMALFLTFGYPRLGWPELASWQELTIGVAITTASWIIVTLLTPPTERAVLQSFYDKIRPIGAGWSRVVDTTQAQPDTGLTEAIACIFLGCAAVYSALFATGSFIYGNLAAGAILSVVCIAAAGGIVKLLPKVQLRG
jgi:solute:Na+ symporter, SSS family